MRTPRLFVQDILEAIAVIEQYTPASLQEFRVNPPIQSHIVRYISIIGEAAARLPQPLRDANPSIPWRQIISMRNFVVHVYHSINWERVYETARQDVPALKGPMEIILNALPPDPTP